MDSQTPGGGWFSRLLRQGGTYAIGNMLLKASGLLLAPLYLNTTLLSQEEFGYFVTLEATAHLAIPLFGLGIATALLKFMVDPDLEDLHTDVPFTAFLLTLVSSAVGFAIFWFVAPWGSTLLFGDAGSAHILRLLGLYVVAKALGYVPLNYIRTRERVVLYVVASVVETIVLIGAVYYFLAVRQEGLEGLIKAFVTASGFGTIVLLGWMLTHVRWRVHPVLLQRMIRFGLPLVIGGIALPFLHTGDRYLLEWLATTEEVAVYGWAAKLSGVVNMFVVQSFQLAFSVLGLKSLADPQEGARIHRRVFRHYTIWAGWIVIGVILVSYDLTALLSTNDAYLKAIPIALPLSLGFLVYGYFVLGLNVIYASGKTHLSAAAVTTSVVTNIALNLVLIPRWGGLGAAVATFIAYCVLAGFALYWAERQIRIDFPWRVFLVVAAIVVGLFALASPAYSWNTGPRLLYFAVLALAYPAVALLLRLYTSEELSRGSEWIRRMLRPS